MTFTTSVAPAVAGDTDATDQFVVTVNLTNSNATGDGVAAQNVVVNFPMPSGLEAVGTYASSDCPTPSSTTFSTTVATIDFSTIALSASCTFTFNVELLPTVNPGQAIVTSGTGTWTSLPGAVTVEAPTYSATSSMRTGNTSNPGGALNNYSSNQSFTINVTPFTLGLVLQNSTAAVAAPVDYVVTLTVPQGTSPALTLTDTLPTGLTFVGNSALSASSQNLSNLTCNGGACVVPTATVSGQTITWSFGNVVNSGTSDASPEVIVFTIDTQVANVSQAVAGAQFANSISVMGTASSPPAAVTATSQKVTVIEPKLTYTATTVASSSPLPPQAGDTLTTTVTVTNATSTNGATAYEPVVTYTMPAGSKLNPVSSTGACVTTATLTPASASFALAAIPMGSSCTFTFTMQLLPAVEPGEVETATFLGTWSSQPNVAGQRDGNTSDPGGALNDYSVSGATQTSLNATATVQGSTTSLLLTSAAQEPIGAIIGYQATITVPQGTTPGAALTLTLPTGLVFQQNGTTTTSTSVSCGTGFSACSFTPAVSNTGHTVTWNFGQVNNSATTDASASISWQILAVVENGSAVAGTTLTATDSFTVNGTVTTPTVGAVTVIKPKPTFSASVNPTTGAAGDVVTVT